MSLTKCGGGRNRLSKSFGPIFAMEVIGNWPKKAVIKMGERWEDEWGGAFYRGVR